MPRAELELLNEVYASFNEEGMQVAFERYAAPDFELRTPAIYPEGPQVYSGRSGVGEWERANKETWGEWRFELDRLLDADPFVLAYARIVATSGASGIPLNREVAHLWMFEGGRPASVTVYLDRDEGRRAAGLEET